MRLTSRLGMFGLIILLSILIAILIVVRDVPSSAVVALIGVLVGSVITSVVQYWIAETRRSQELRLAALDRRLESSQRAYHLWRRLVFADKRSREVFDVIQECQDWWDRNCIYLDAEAREAFLRAFHAASDHDAYVAAHADKTLLMDTMQTAVGAGDLILKGVALPSIGEIESKPIWPGRKSPDA